MTSNESIKLTQYSHGAGCGCKISPAILDEILSESGQNENFTNLLAGHDKKEDAALWDQGDGTALISTTDFFMPITDNAFDFGQIAAANSLSDVYAMGGKPLFALAILGWPVNVLPVELASETIRGGREMCRLAGIPIAGGHSIDSPEPFFGLAVTGTVPIQNIKKNDGAVAGCSLYLTKPLGIGLLTTLEKGTIIKQELRGQALIQMKILNNIGEEFGKLPYIKAMTDVTGFGLAGHLLEICEASDLTAEIEFEKIPIIDAARNYLFPFLAPEGTSRNWKSYENKIQLSAENQFVILADPQTNGGLLVAVEHGFESNFENFCLEKGLVIQAIGKMTEEKEKRIYCI